MMFFGDGEAWQEVLLEGFNAKARNKGSKGHLAGKLNI
jgi:hypothetical protein